jgi:tight adherence protein B
MLLSSSLRAGMSLNQSFEVLAEELPAPISDEFALVVKENQMGVSLEDCLAHLKQRMPVSDLDLISTAINIARETGGDLTEIFAQLVYTMREKRKLEDRVKALTVQGRLQGLIMGILPIAFGVFIYFTNPENFQILLEDKLGQALLMYAMVSEVIGIILIKRLSKVEV